MPRMVYQLIMERTITFTSVVGVKVIILIRILQSPVSIKTVVKDGFTDLMVLAMMKIWLIQLSMAQMGMYMLQGSARTVFLT